MEAFCRTCALEFEKYKSYSLHKAKNLRHKQFKAANIRMTKLPEYLELIK